MSRCRCKVFPRAFTLLEATIVFSLMIVLMILVSMYFVRGQRYTLETETYASVQRNSTIILRKITSDLYRSTEKYLNISPSGDAVWFLSSGSSDPSQPFVEFRQANGKILWRKWVCYYHDASTESILRAEIPLATPDSELLVPPSPTPTLSDFQTSSSASRQPVGRQVKSFQVSATTKGLIVSLTTHAQVPLTNTQADQRIVEVNIASQVTLIN